eukprot:gnl/Chilomastix_caulleri/2371.p1 GENE.gnl/Chilomastix_caulleri/2371~~gnl/Chilomastix_caulleri/2371.p1  ORF type:complete len:97 (+),score=12.44 gnl/Chilomastix_caulleri/2371:71-361(+)
MVYLLNMNETEYVRQRAKGLKQAVEWIQANSPGDSIIPYCASLEYRICQLPKEQKKLNWQQLSVTLNSVKLLILDIVIFILFIISQLEKMKYVAGQ